MLIDIREIVRDEGSVVLFRGYELDENDDPTNDLITFAVDHRMTQPLADYINHPENSVMEHGVVEIEDWQIVSRLEDPNNEGGQ